MVRAMTQTSTQPPTDKTALTERRAPAWVNVVVDYGPLILFFAAYELSGLRVATIAVMIASLIAVAVGWVFTRRFAFIPVMTAVIVAVLGGLTLYLNDPDFIKMKPTIVYLLFAAVIAIEIVSGRPLLGKAMTAAMPPIDGNGKRALLVRFLVFFVAMAAINEVARRVLSTDHWVTWKVFGSMGLTFIFILAQMPLVKRHKLPEPVPPTNS